MSVNNLIDEITQSRDIIRSKMMSAGQAASSDQLSTLASNLRMAHTIQNKGGGDMTNRQTLQFAGDLETADDSTTEKTVVKSHELTDEEMTNIMSVLPGYETGGVVIDFTGKEYVIGKVIQSDGTEKKLYQKTIVDTMPSEIDHNKLISIGALVDQVVNIQGYMAISNRYQSIGIGIDNIFSNFSKIMVSTNYDSDEYKNKIFLRTNNISWIDLPVYITIKYTKISD